MSEQGITQEDCEWINQRLDGGGSCFQDMEAAPARGYERGKAEGTADRDRLAKRVAELERVVEFEPHLGWEAAARGDQEAGANADRLAALEQRVGELIDMEADVTSGAIGWTEYRSRLAALRAPRVATSPMDAEVLYQKVWDALKDVPTGGKFHAYEVVADVVAALATARREREEALGVVRRYLAWADDAPGAESLETIGADFRALVAGKPTPDPRGEDGPHSCAAAEQAIESLEADVAARDAEIERLKEERDRLALSLKNYRTSFSRLERQRDALRAHALKLDGLCERALSDDVTGMKWGRFAADLRARGEVPR